MHVKLQLPWKYSKKFYHSQCNCKSNNATVEFLGGKGHIGLLLLLVPTCYRSQLGGFQECEPLESLLCLVIRDSWLLELAERRKHCRPLVVSTSTWRTKEMNAVGAFSTESRHSHTFHCSITLVKLSMHRLLFLISTI